MKKGIIFSIIGIIGSTVIHAQSFNFDIAFAVGAPQGSFQQTLDRNSFGLDGAFTYQIADLPVQIGAGLVYQNFGWKERYEYLSPNIPEVDVRVRTTNNMVTPHLILRFEPTRGAVRPFVEGTWGFNYLYTETSVLDEWEDEEIFSTINYDYFTSNIGIGGGMKFNLWEGFDEDGDYFKLSLIVKARYMIGGEALYMKEGDLVNTGDGVEYNISRSRTDLNTFNIGFMFSF
tara:strand:+ start:141986 stop:142678 length:693 start_codon:yes stop_codon:yes gene_type:complete